MREAKLRTEVLKAGNCVEKDTQLFVEHDQGDVELTKIAIESCLSCAELTECRRTLGSRALQITYPEVEEPVILGGFETWPIEKRQSETNIMAIILLRSSARDPQQTLIDMRSALFQGEITLVNNSIKIYQAAAFFPEVTRKLITANPKYALDGRLAQALQTLATAFVRYEKKYQELHDPRSRKYKFALDVDDFSSLAEVYMQEVHTLREMGVSERVHESALRKGSDMLGKLFEKYKNDEDISPTFIVRSFSRRTNPVEILEQKKERIQNIRRIYSDNPYVTDTVIKRLLLRDDEKIIDRYLENVKELEQRFAGDSRFTPDVIKKISLNNINNAVEAAILYTKPSLSKKQVYGIRAQRENNIMASLPEEVREILSKPMNQKHRLAFKYLTEMQQMRKRKLIKMQKTPAPGITPKILKTVKNRIPEFISDKELEIYSEKLVTLMCESMNVTGNKWLYARESNITAVLEVYFLQAYGFRKLNIQTPCLVALWNTLKDYRKMHIETANNEDIYPMTLKKAFFHKRTNPERYIEQFAATVTSLKDHYPEGFAALLRRHAYRINVESTMNTVVYAIDYLQEKYKTDEIITPGYMKEICLIQPERAIDLAAALKEMVLWQLQKHPDTKLHIGLIKRLCINQASTALLEVYTGQRNMDILPDVITNYHNNVKLLQDKYPNNVYISPSIIHIYAVSNKNLLRVTEGYLARASKLKAYAIRRTPINSNTIIAIARNLRIFTRYHAWEKAYFQLRQKYSNDHDVEDWMIQRSALYPKTADIGMDFLRSRNVNNRLGVKSIEAMTEGYLRDRADVIKDPNLNPEERIVAKELQAEMRSKIDVALSRLSKLEQQAVFTVFGIDSYEQTFSTIELEEALGVANLEQYVHGKILPKLQSPQEED